MIRHKDICNQTKLEIVGFLLKPTLGLRGWDSKEAKDKEQIGETDLIRPQSRHQISQLNPRKCQQSHGG